MDTEARQVVSFLKGHDLNPKQIRLYSLRHSWACNYLDTTGDIFSSAMTMGTSVKMLQQRYFHMDEEKMHAKYLAHIATQRSGLPSAPETVAS